MSDRPLPLVLDLDDTLVRTDTLLEQLLLVAFRAPKKLPRVVLSLLRGRAALKRAAHEAIELDVRTLPYDDALLSYATAHKEAGGEVHLFTAADQRLAEQVGEHLGIFDSVTGTLEGRNLKGADKARAIEEKFGERFAYAGDSLADLHVWRLSREVLFVGRNAQVRRALARERMAPHRTFERPVGGLKSWLKALRVHQWAKNGVVLVPLLLSHEYRDPLMLVRAVAGLMLFNLVASSTYILNDLSDLAADRMHPTKRRRPIAAGTIHIRSAVPVAAILLLGGLVASLGLHPLFGTVTLAYVAMTLLYSFSLKAQPLIDVMTIGGLFTLRVVAGMVLIDTPISLWLGAFTFMLFTSLALAKRNGELVRAANAGRTVAGRGYLAADAQVTTPLGISTGVTSVLVMVLYMELEARQTGLYAHVEPLFLIPVVLAAWILRIWLRAHRGELQDDPVVFALRDKVSWFHAAAVVGLWLLSNFSWIR